MAADLENPFGESCCDGGGSSDCHQSAKMCGCDPSAGWVCARHVAEVQPQQGPGFSVPVTETTPVQQDPLAIHLREVVNKTWDYAGRLRDFQDEVMNASLGLVGEAGEVADTVKKMFFHTEAPGRRAELLLECGDVAYYYTKLLDLFGFTLEEVLEANKKKLFERHGK